jgi:hypothetical protein
MRSYKILKNSTGKRGAKHVVNLNVGLESDP